MAAHSHKSRVRRFFGGLLDMLEAFVVSLFVIMLACGFLLELVDVEGSSMNPTLRENDRLLAWRLGYEPKVSDIVIIDDAYGGHFYDEVVIDTPALDKRIVKRIIAVEGQTLDIDFEHGFVIRDGIVLNEPYIAELTNRNDEAFTYPITIPKGYIFVMGDNRNGSNDSRNPDVGLVPNDQVVGRVLFRYWRDAKFCKHWWNRFGFLFL